MRIPRLARDTAAVATKLRAEQRRQLLALVQHPGWLVFLELMRVKCVLQDATLNGVDAADEKRVLAEHRIAQATWEMFDWAQNQVQHEINEEFGGDEAEASGGEMEELQEPGMSDLLAVPRGTKKQRAAGAQGEEA